MQDKFRLFLKSCGSIFSMGNRRISIGCSATFMSRVRPPIHSTRDKTRPVGATRRSPLQHRRVVPTPRVASGILSSIIPKMGRGQISFLQPSTPTRFAKRQFPDPHNLRKSLNFIPCECGDRARTPEAFPGWYCTACFSAMSDYHYPNPKRHQDVFYDRITGSPRNQGVKPTLSHPVDPLRPVKRTL